MKNVYAIVGVVVAVVALVAFGVWWFVFRSPRTLSASSAAASSGPKKKTGCNPAVVDAQVNAAVASGQAGAAETGLPAGGAVAAAPQIVSLATGQCAKDAEKKLRELAAAGVKGAREALHHFERESRKAADKAVLGPQRRAVSSGAKKTAKKIKGGVKGAAKKVFG